MKHFPKKFHKNAFRFLKYSPNSSPCHCNRNHIPSPKILVAPHYCPNLPELKRVDRSISLRAHRTVYFSFGTLVCKYPIRTMRPDYLRPIVIEEILQQLGRLCNLKIVELFPVSE